MLSPGGITSTLPDSDVPGFSIIRLATVFCGGYGRYRRLVFCLKRRISSVKESVKHVGSATFGATLFVESLRYHIAEIAQEVVLIQPCRIHDSQAPRSRLEGFEPGIDILKVVSVVVGCRNCLEAQL